MAAFALRIFYAGGQSITFDEFYEIQLAKESVGHILLRGDGFPPLYSLLLHVWDFFFGSESGRVFSMLTGTAGCFAIFHLGQTVFDRRVGLWSAAILAVLPLHLFYTSEIRAYPLLLLATTLALNSLVLAIRYDLWRDWLLFSVATTIGLHTHYLFAIFPAMTLLASLFYVRSNKPYISGAIILLLLVPLATYCVKADVAMQQGWAYRVHFGIGELAYTYGSFLMGYTLGPSLRQLHVLWTRDAIFYALPWATFFLVALGGIFFAAKKGKLFEKREVPLLCALSLAPLMVGLMCKLSGVGYQVRYSIWAMVPIVVLIAALVSSAVERLVGKVATAFLFGLFVLAMINRHYVDEYRNADLAAVTQRLSDPELSVRQPLLVISGYMVEPVKHYLDETEWSLFGIPMDSSYEQREAELASLLSAIKQVDSHFWLLYTREFHEDPDGVLLQRLNKESDLEFVSKYAGIRLYRGSFPSDGDANVAPTAKPPTDELSVD